MKFLYSPKDLLSLITNADKYSLADKVTVEWFFSEDGEKAYNEASVSKKTRMFYEYLSLADAKENAKIKKARLKTAYLLASAVSGSELEYGSYPDIFSPEKNPFIRHYITERTFKTTELLSILRDMPPEAFTDGRPYFNMTYQKKSGYRRDIYKIERTIMALGKDKKSGILNPPFAYSYELFKEGEKND